MPESAAPLFVPVIKRAQVKPSKTTLLPIDMERWPERIVRAAYTQNPWLDDYGAEVVIKSSDPELKSAVGHILVYPSSPSGEEERRTGVTTDQVQPPDPKIGLGEDPANPAFLPHRVERLPVRLPFVAREGLLYPINLIIDEQGQPPMQLLTKERFEKVMGLVGKDMEPSPDRDKSYSSVPPTEVYTNMVQKISGFVHGRDKNRVLDSLMKVGAAPMSVARVASMHTFDMGTMPPDLLYLRRTPKGVHIKAACVRAFRGIETGDISMSEAQQLLEAYGMGDQYESLQKTGSSVVVTCHDLEEAPIPVGEMDIAYRDVNDLLRGQGTPLAKVACVETNHGQKQGLIAEVTGRDGGSYNFFVGQNTAAIVKEGTAGAEADPTRVRVPVGRPEVGLTGVFLSGGRMTEPLKVAGITHLDGGEWWLDVEPVIGAGDYRIVAADGVKGLSWDEDKNELWISKKAAFLLFEDMVETHTETSIKQASAGLSRSGVLVHGQDDCFSLKNTGAIDEDALGREDALFRLMVLGVEKEAAWELLKQAGRPQGASFMLPMPLRDHEENMRKMGAAALEFSKEIYDLRPDDELVEVIGRLSRQLQDDPMPKLAAREDLGTLFAESVKAAAMAAGQQQPQDGLDDILSLTFLSPENVSIFIESAPKLEDTGRMLAMMLYSSYLGLDMNASDLVVAAGAHDRIIKGLNKLRMRAELA